MNKSNSRIKSNIIPYNSNNIGFSSSISSKKNNSHNKHSFDISLQKTNSKSVQKNTNSINIKYGERLYHKGIAYKKLIENKIQKLKISILDKQLTQCTFHPKTLKVRVISIEKIKKNKKKIKKKENQMIIIIIISKKV